MARVRPKRRQIKVSAWSQSAAFRKIGSDAIRAFNKRRHLLPKCKATAKNTGERCRHLALANGCCYYHGGRTPKGDEWHVLQVRSGKAKHDVRKHEQKLAKKEKLAAARRLRLKRADEAEQAAYAKWLASHTPGSATRRAAKRMDRRIASSRRALVAAPGGAQDSEEIESLKKYLEVLNARRAELELWMTGVFA